VAFALALGPCAQHERWVMEAISRKRGETIAGRAVA
jgi:hypothetical protein